MNLIAGLGNPGNKYQNTRHNAGFMAVDQLADQMKLTWALDNKRESLLAKSPEPEIILVKPQTFMNRSGFAIVQMINFYKVNIDNFWLIHDDLDIELGDYKIQKSKGPRQHNGVDSVELQLGIKDFWRVRIGVDNRDQTSLENSPRIPGQKYVLQPFTQEELPQIKQAIKQISQEIIRRLDGFIRSSI